MDLMYSTAWTRHTHLFSEVPKEKIVVPLDDVTVPMVSPEHRRLEERMLDDGPNPSGRRTGGLTTQSPPAFTVDDTDN